MELIKLEISVRKCYAIYFNFKLKLSYGYNFNGICGDITYSVTAKTLSHETDVYM